MYLTIHSNNTQWGKKRKGSHLCIDASGCLLLSWPMTAKRKNRGWLLPLCSSAMQTWANDYCEYEVRGLHTWYVPRLGNMGYVCCLHAVTVYDSNKKQASPLLIRMQWYTVTVDTSSCRYNEGHLSRQLGNVGSVSYVHVQAVTIFDIKKNLRVNCSQAGLHIWDSSNGSFMIAINCSDSSQV